MKNKLIAFGCCILALLGSVAAQEICPVIPLPASASNNGSVFRITTQTALVAPQQVSKDAALYFQQQLQQFTGIRLNLQTQARSAAIVWMQDTTLAVAKEAYAVDIRQDKIRIRAADAAGMMHAAATVLQLCLAGKQEKNSITVSGWHIEDAPLYAWRGCMLDESRHFFGENQVKQLLNWMALYKLNRFHWHLTDEPAWRLEIKAYPQLALTGGKGAYKSTDTTVHYYTQEQIKTIVAYAAKLQITVIPEIDMPGHATAANKAYPAFSGGGSRDHPEFTFNPAKDTTYAYLSAILHEVKALFPAQSIHIGGDEVSYGNAAWHSDTAIARLMKEQNLADTRAVEFYFMRRMADTLQKMNCRILAWDEATAAGLPVQQTTIFWWRHNLPDQLAAALRKGYDVVLCPRIPLYFDFVQDSAHHTGRKWQGVFASPEQVYNFTPSLYLRDSAYAGHIIGVQANLWTETVATTKRLQYLLFPRMAALAEAAWTPAASRSWKGFEARLTPQFNWYDKQGIYYFNPFAAGRHPEPKQ